MKFTMNTKEMRELLESIQMKGKYSTSNGFSNSSLGTEVYFVLNDNLLRVYNGDATFLVRADTTVQGEENGTCCCDVSQILSYCKTFGENTMFHVTDFITLSSGSKKATIPIILDNTSLAMYNALNKNLGDVTYTLSPTELPSFGTGKFEGVFTLTSDDFESCMQSMELVKAGTYRLDFTDSREVKFSSRISTENRYEETMNTVYTYGEAATVQFTSPLHRLFRKGEVLNFFVKDEFPVLIMSNNRLLIKAPVVTEG